MACHDSLTRMDLDKTRLTKDDSPGFLKPEGYRKT